MAGPPVLIFHRPARPDEPALVALLAEVRARLADDQAFLFRQAGAGEVRLIDISQATADSFGRALSAVVPRDGGVIVMGSGAVPRLNERDAAQLVRAAAGAGRLALTNNRYSSDICAISDAGALADLPALPSDNALPRWLEERAEFRVAELRARERLALDLDTPLDIALATRAPSAPGWLRRLARAAGIIVPRTDELRSLAADPYRELLVFGRTGSATLRWLERNVRCRVRFLAEERGLRASTPLAIASAPPASPVTPGRPPRGTIGRLLHQRGPAAFGEIVAELGDGAIIDSRVLIADRFGAREADWPSPADRYASDLLRADAIGDPWLRALTAAAAASRVPIALGAHTLVGPGIALLLGRPPRQPRPG